MTPLDALMVVLVVPQVVVVTAGLILLTGRLRDHIDYLRRKRASDRHHRRECECKSGRWCSAGPTLVDLVNLKEP